jgi:hypothetical protein
MLWGVELLVEAAESVEMSFDGRHPKRYQVCGVPPTS